MNNVSTFLSKLQSDVFKLLPMREDADAGKDNHLTDYIFSLIINAEGAVSTYKNLEKSKSYIYVINNLNYLHSHSDLEFANWRKIVLNCTRSLNDMSKMSAGGK